MSATCARAGRASRGDRPIFAARLRSAPQFTWNLYTTAAQCGAMATQTPAPPHGGPNEALPKLMLGAVGVVYGDIGTSPLYAMKETFVGPHPLAVDPLHIFGVLSL